MPGQSEDAGQDGQPKHAQGVQLLHSSESENMRNGWELLAQIEQLIAEQDALNEELAAQRRAVRLRPTPGRGAGATGQRSSGGANGCRSDYPDRCAGADVIRSAGGGGEPAWPGFRRDREQALGQAQLGAEGEGTLTDAAERCGPPGQRSHPLRGQ